VIIALLLALVAAMAAGTGVALQQRASHEEDAHAVMDPRLVMRLFRRRTWIIGIAIGTSGAVLQAAAIARGRLVLVEPVLAMSVLFALLVSARHAGRRLGPREWRGLAFTIVGAAGFLIVAAPSEGADRSPVVSWAVPLTVLGVVVVAGVLLLRRLPSEPRGLSLAMLAGLGFGTADALIKLISDVGGIDGAGGIFTHWGIYAWMVVSPLAFLLQQSALHTTHLGAAMPGTSTLQPPTAALLGALMFGEQIRGGWAIPVELALAVVMLAGVVLLSSSPLIEAEPELEPGNSS
jgi:drug/metabolite transporter (DMT)-like permease